MSFRGKKKAITCQITMAKTLTKKKAKTILREGEARGKKLTKRQKGFFGARAGGAPVRRKKKKK